MSAGAVADVRTNPNGAKMAKSIPRKDAGFREISSNVAAIDFGTTQCSVAYITENDAHPQRLKLSVNYERVPNAALFRSDGTLMAFGVNALAEYAKNLKDAERLGYYYFDKIKVELQHDEEVSRDKIVEAANGTKFYLVDVIAQILRYLKEELLESLYRMNGRRMRATDFDWVITVPAIWKARGKQMMREAGYKAGLCSQNSCGILRPADDIAPEQCHEDNPDKLLLALEPESASLHCKCETPQRFQPPASYLVVDIGGGTVDICGYRIQETGGSCHMEMIQQPTGGMYGGFIVNKKFQEFLEKAVNDTGLTKYTRTPDDHTKAKNKADLKWLIGHTFEEQKKIFGSKSSGTTGRLSIQLPPSFATVYEGELKRGLQNDLDVEYDPDDQDLRITYEKMKQFFDPITSRIRTYISEAISRMNEVNTIFLVGGFGGCEYIHSIITEAFGDRCCVPKDPYLSVVMGAVLFGHNPDVIYARRADATYGVETSLKFNSDIHDQDYWYLSDDRIPYCGKIFKPYVIRGDPICTGEVFVGTLTPVYHNATFVEVPIYSSYEKEVWYTTGKRGKHSKSKTPAHVYHLGTLNVDMPIPDGDTNRMVEVTFDFSRNEIQIKGYDVTSGDEVKVAVDFLSQNAHGN